MQASPAALVVETFGWRKVRLCVRPGQAACGIAGIAGIAARAGERGGGRAGTPGRLRMRSMTGVSRIAAMIFSSPPQFGQCSKSISNTRSIVAAPSSSTGRLQTSLSLVPGHGRDCQFATEPESRPSTALLRDAPLLDGRLSSSATYSLSRPSAVARGWQLQCASAASLRRQACQSSNPLWLEPPRKAVLDWPRLGHIARLSRDRKP